MDRTLTLFQYKDFSDNGTGTLFRLGDHVLIATAGHLIKENPNRRTWPATEQVRHEKEGLPAYVRFARHPTLDIGYLEVCPNAVEPYFGDRVFASLSEISLVGTGRENKSDVVVGAPAEHTNVQKHSDVSASIGARILFYWSVPILVSDWPQVVSDPLNVANDVVVDYPDDEQMKSEGLPAINLPNPSGLSGGGVWDQGFESGQIWHPENARLVAIQSRWCPKNRYLRAVQIHHWLRLVYRDYPDLRQLIEQQHGLGPWELA